MTGSLEAVLVDPVVVAWKALGAPAPVATSGPVARCGRCSQEQSLNLFREILSSNFTGWETLDPTSKGLCQSCSWAYTEAHLRTTPMMIAHESAHAASVSELKIALASALSQRLAISLPIRGQKHLLPSCRWGSISSDFGVISWDDQAALLFVDMLTAREAGAKSADLESHAPSIDVVRSAGEQAFDWWQTFRRWQGTPQFSIAQYVAGRSS